MKKININEIICFLKDLFWIIKTLIKLALFVFCCLFFMVSILVVTELYLYKIKENPLIITDYKIWTQNDLGKYLENNNVFIYVLNKNVIYNNEKYYMFGSRYDPHRSIKDFKKKFLIKKDDIHILEIDRYEQGSTIFSYYCTKLFVFDEYKPKSKNLNYKNYNILKNDHYDIGCSKQPRKNNIKIKDEWIKLK